MVFCAYLRKYCTDLGQIWLEYTLVGGGSSNGAGGYAILNMGILISWLYVKIRFFAHLFKYCTDLVPLGHEYTLADGASDNGVSGHASLNMHILIN
jgi:hypothetical protein